jgi:hypothetical protein
MVAKEIFIKKKYRVTEAGGAMNKKNSMAGIVLMTLLLILSGCGERGELGGTGVAINSVNIVASDEGAGDHEIDAAIHQCDPGPPPTYEDGLFQVDAVLTINASATGFDDAFPATVDKCTVTYIKGEENPDAPIIESLTLYPFCTLTEDEANECNVLMMDVDAKHKWWDDANAINFPQTYPTHYIVRYDCTYINKYDREEFDPILYDIFIADWDNC